MIQKLCMIVISISVDMAWYPMCVEQIKEMIIDSEYRHAGLLVMWKIIK